LDQNLMSDTTPSHWKPSPELLAAYADGELEARDDPDGLRARIEAWLAAHPEAQAELTANQRLKALWDRTAPPTLSSEAWNEVVKRVERLSAPKPEGRRPSAAWLIGAGVAAACLLGAILAGSYWKAPPAAAPEVFAVVGEDDIEITHIDGDAIDSLVVGALAFRGLLELADAGEIFVMSVEPAPRDAMKPVIDKERPIVWARIDWGENGEE
jgi:hypothetical protein